MICAEGQQNTVQYVFDHKDKCHLHRTKNLDRASIMLTYLANIMLLLDPRTNLHEMKNFVKAEYHRVEKIFS